MGFRPVASFIHLRPAPDELEYYVAEAVHALGYFREDAIDELAAIYRVLWPKGTSAHMLDQADYQHLLSEKGLADLGGVRATTHRISFNLRKWEHLRDEPQWSTFASKVTFFCSKRDACEAALQLQGEVIGREGRPPLPLLACDKEWCACEWDYVPD